MTASKLFLALALLLPSISFADADLTSPKGSRCSARAIDRFYCPTGGGQWWGPYFDNGCSVKCAEGQQAVCETASCDDRQNGDSVPSSCECK